MRRGNTVRVAGNVNKQVHSKDNVDVVNFHKVHYHLSEDFSSITFKYES